MKRVGWASSVGMGGVLFGLAASASGAVIDRSAFGLRPNLSPTFFVVADDFVVAEETRLLAADVWLADSTQNDNGLLDQFEGTIGWAIFTNNAGAPGSLVVSGRGLGVTASDTGFQWLDDTPSFDSGGPQRGLSVRPDGPERGNAYGDLVRVRFELEPAVTLPPATYWFALREGAWGSAGGLTVVYWARHAVVGASARYSLDPLAPPIWIDSLSDAAFVLYGGRAAWSQYTDAVLTNSNEQISNYTLANDFSLAEGGTFGSADVWLADGFSNDDGVLQSFNGTLGWAVYTNSSSAPGSILASGQDPAPRMADTLVQNFDNADVFHARLRFGALPALAAGTYWFALHEGSWGSGNDGSSVWMMESTSVAGAGSYRGQANGTSYTAQPWDTAFVLFDELVFGSGFDDGGACAWSSVSGGTLCNPLDF